MLISLLSDSEEEDIAPSLHFQQAPVIPASLRRLYARQCAEGDRVTAVVLANEDNGSVDSRPAQPISENRCDAPKSSEAIITHIEEQRPIVIDADVFQTECSEAALIRQNVDELPATPPIPWHSYCYDDIIDCAQEEVTPDAITRSVIEEDRIQSGEKLDDPPPCRSNRTGRPEVDYKALYFRGKNKNAAQRHRTAKKKTSILPH